MKYSTKRKGNNGITSAVSSGSQPEASCSFRNLCPHRAKQGAWRTVNFQWMVGSVNEQTLNTHQTQISLLHILFFTPSRAQEHPLGEWNRLPGCPPHWASAGAAKSPQGGKNTRCVNPPAEGQLPQVLLPLLNLFLTLSFSVLYVYGG